MKTRRLSLAVALTIVLAGSTTGSRASEHPELGAREVTAALQTDAWVQRLQRWLLAVERHEPGTADAEARLFASWSRSDLRTLLADITTLRDLLARVHAHPAKPGERQVITYGGREFQTSEVEQLLGLTADEAPRGDVNRILKGGALLHTDIAMFVPSEDRPVVSRQPVVRLRDGQFDGFEYSAAAHWEFARNLLDATRPDPSQDETILLWYKASAAYLQSHFVLRDAVGQLQRARELFPEDGAIFFYSGCVEEAFTSPLVQNALQSIVLPPGRKVDLGSPRSHLQQAETFFRKALQRDSRLTEARVRLAHVLGALGRHEEAADELRRAATTSAGSLMRYYANMFLGDEEQALGHHEAAREWYESAARLYPGAQSPLFALSQLASSSGDREGALRATDRIVQLPANEAERADPWPVYYQVAGRDAGELLAQLRAALPRARKQ